MINVAHVIELCLPVGLTIAYLPVSAVFGTLSPMGLFKGCVTNREFKVMLDLIFDDPDVHYDGYNVRGSEYVCWVVDGYPFFNINDIKRFSVYQKVLFFSRFESRFDKEIKKKKAEEKLKEARAKATAATIKAKRIEPNINQILHLDKVNEIIFHNELDKKLDKE